MRKEWMGRERCLIGVKEKRSCKVGGGEGGWGEGEREGEGGGGRGGIGGKGERDSGVKDLALLRFVEDVFGRYLHSC